MTHSAGHWDDERKAGKSTFGQMHFYII